MTVPALAAETHNFVAGRWETGGSGDWVERHDPADRATVVARAPDSSPDDSRRAVQAAAAALADWRRYPPPRRGRLLFDWLVWLDAKRHDLARLVTRENGKTLAESVEEVERAIEVLEFTAGMGRRLRGTTYPGDPSVLCWSRPRALGVVALISPWNFPVAIPVWKLAPALVAGNTVVLKPSPLSPATAAMLVAGLEAVGVPQGVVNLVHGGAATGAALVASAGVRGVSFTGSTGVGQEIARAAAGRLLKIQLELGGKNPQLVLDDADLELAVTAVVAAAFGCAGQRCSATSRAIVALEVYDRFLGAVVERAASLIVGPGTVPDVHMGPVVSDAALSRVAGAVARAESEGAKVHLGGSPLTGPHYGRGSFFPPTVLEATPSMRIAREEVFGPVLAVIPARDTDDAIRLANDVPYALSASVFTRDVGRMVRVAEEVEAGVIHLNRAGTGGYPHAPIGGRGDSGYGAPEVGEEVLSFYTESTLAYLEHGPDSILPVSNDEHSFTRRTPGGGA